MAIHYGRIEKRALELVARELPTANNISREAVSPEKEALRKNTLRAIVAVLEQYDWTFAQKRKKLMPSRIYTKDQNKLNNNPRLYTDEYLGWANKYKLPEDYLGYLKVYNNLWTQTFNNVGTQRAWWIEGKSLYTLLDFSEKGISIQYTHIFTEGDEEQYSLPELVELSVVYLLAHLIAPSLTGSFASSEQYRLLYERTILRAKEIDMRNRAPLIRRLS